MLKHVHLKSANSPTPRALPDTDSGSKTLIRISEDQICRSMQLLISTDGAEASHMKIGQPWKVSFKQMQLTKRAGIQRCLLG